MIAHLRPRWIPHLNHPHHTSATITPPPLYPLFPAVSQASQGSSDRRKSASGLHQVSQIRDGGDFLFPYSPSLLTLSFNQVLGSRLQPDFLFSPPPRPEKWMKRVCLIWRHRSVLKVRLFSPGDVSFLNLLSVTLFILLKLMCGST